MDWSGTCVEWVTAQKFCHERDPLNTFGSLLRNFVKYVKHSEGYHKTVGSKYLVGSSAPPYCNSKHPTNLAMVDARVQHRLIDQLFSVPKCVRLSSMSEKSYELLVKILRAAPEGSRDELEEIVEEVFAKLGDGTISEFQKKKASGTMSNDFLLTHGEYPCRCQVQTFWYPKRANLVLVGDIGELFSMGLPDQTQNVTI